MNFHLSKETISSHFFYCLYVTITVVKPTREVYIMIWTLMLYLSGYVRQRNISISQVNNIIIQATMASPGPLVPYNHLTLFRLCYALML